jgi:two-component system phosphate regulon sensor histidine kinase PhoR
VALILAVGRLARLRRREAVVEAQQAFLSTVSHELRTPIAEIRAFSEVLKRQRPVSDRTSARAVDGIEHAAQHLGLLVENVLRMGRPPATGEHPVPSRVTTDVLAELQGTLEAFRPIAERRAVELDVDVPEGTRVRVPPFALRQVVLNLLDNAVKYGPPGQRVRIAVQRDGARVQLAVQDDGPGIPVAQREHVWRPFKRGAETHGAAGSGLGLAVVRAIAEDYGGTATFADVPTGLRVQVTFPGDDT